MPAHQTRHRRSLRLQTYDYSSHGAYFVTVCAYGRECLFEETTLKAIIERTWQSLPQRFPSVSLDAFVVMPNHLHFILWLDSVGAPLAGALGGAGASPADIEQAGLGAPLAGTLGGAGASPADVEQARLGAPLAGALGGAGASPAPTLGDVVGSFKSIVATEWLGWIKASAPHRSGRVWQRNYFERVVRDDDELGRIREYIALNPLKWHLDSENPERQPDMDWQERWSWLEEGLLV